MKAVVKTAPGEGNIEVLEVPEPELRAGEVLIRVHAVGVCGTDLHIWHDEFPNDPPVIIGHEFSGTIQQVSEGVEGWSVGDAVVSEPHTGACGACWLCRSGQAQVCEKKRPIGSRTNGAFAELIRMPAWLLHRAPRNVSLDEAAVMEPTACVIHALLERTRVVAGDFVAVVGPGPIGLLAAQVARAAGARQVVVMGMDADEPTRLPIARQLGFDQIINVQREDPVARVRDLAGGTGADVVVEGSGSQGGIGLAMEMVARHGRICAIGLTRAREVTVPWNLAVLKGVDAAFPFSSTHFSWERGIALVESGEVRTGPLITQRMALEQWREAFELLVDGSATKILLKPELVAP